MTKVKIENHTYQEDYTRKLIDTCEHDTWTYKGLETEDGEVYASFECVSCLGIIHQFVGELVSPPGTE